MGNEMDMPLKEEGGQGDRLQDFVSNLLEEHTQETEFCGNESQQGRRKTSNPLSQSTAWLQQSDVSNGWFDMAKYHTNHHLTNISQFEPPSPDIRGHSFNGPIGQKGLG